MHAIYPTGHQLNATSWNILKDSYILARDLHYQNKGLMVGKKLSVDDGKLVSIRKMVISDVSRNQGFSMFIFRYSILLQGWMRPFLKRGGVATQDKKGGFQPYVTIHMY